VTAHGSPGGALQFDRLEATLAAVFHRKIKGERFDTGEGGHMRMNLKQCMWIGVMTLGISISGGTARVAASAPQEQHEQDYSKNKNYKVGMRDGRDDFNRNKDHSKKRSFKKDEDQKAYEAGYQGGHHK